MVNGESILFLFFCQLHGQFWDAAPFLHRAIVEFSLIAEDTCREIHYARGLSDKTISNNFFFLIGNNGVKITLKLIDWFKNIVLVNHVGVLNVFGTGNVAITWVAGWFTIVKFCHTRINDCNCFRFKIV